MSVIDTLAGALNDAGNASGANAIAHTATNAIAGFALSNIASWVLTGTREALRQVASSINASTAPNLESTWFSSTYWRVAALAAMLTVPFICAAAVQALARSDMALLAKSVFGYLPLSLIGVSLAAPLTMLLLAATDQMSSAVSATGIKGGAHFLDQAAGAAATLSASSDTPFFGVIIGLFAILAALALAIELLVREAAVYVVVLMLPLAFAAMVWPARRVWAARLVELLISLILSKFVIVAVLSLAGAALASGSNELSTLLTAMALVIFATFAPWALMRILPFTELAAGAAGMMRHELPRINDSAQRLWGHSGDAAEVAMGLPERLRRQAQDAGSGFSSQDAAPTRAGAPVSAASGRDQSDSTSSRRSRSARTERSTEPSAGADSTIEPSPEGRSGSSAEPSTVLGAQSTVAPEPGPATASGPAAQSEPVTAPEPIGQPGPTSSGAQSRSEFARDTAPPVDAAPSPNVAPSSGIPSDDPRGPVQLPEMWRTDGESWDELPELILGPELATGTFTDVPSTGLPSDEGAK